MSASQTYSSFSTFKGFLSGIVIGGLAGTALMWLTAPQAGKKTRAQLLQAGTELRDQVEEKIDDTRLSAEHAWWQARLKARQLKRNAEVALHEFQHQSQTLLEEQKTRVGATLEALQQPAKNGHR